MAFIGNACREETATCRITGIPAKIARVLRFNRSGDRTRADCRAYNQRLVLSLVYAHGSLAKTDISRMTGLSAQTGSVLMRELEAEDLIVKGEPIRGKVGQPSVPLSINP
jgi:CRP-like cAMP-binding protein